MYQYEIKAIYKPTNKRRTIKIDAPNKEDALAYARADSDYLEPFEVEEFFDPPTDRQLEYAKDLKLSIPKGASIRDASALIDRAVTLDSDPNPGLIEFAKGRNILFSQYIGKKALYNIVFNKLPLLDKIAFFIFAVYRWLVDDRHANLDTHRDREYFYELAEICVADNKFVKSVNSYAGEDLRIFGTMKIDEGHGELIEVIGGSTTAVAYKICADFIGEKYGVPRKRAVYKRASYENKRRHVERADKKVEQPKRGCTAASIVIISIAVLIWLF